MRKKRKTVNAKKVTAADDPRVAETEVTGSYVFRLTPRGAHDRPG